MKKYIEFLAVVLLMQTGSSCKDYLDPESTSSFTESTVFTTNIDFIDKAVLSIYSELADYYAWHTWMMTASVDTDQEFYPAANDNAGSSMAHYALTTGINQLEQMWNAFYTTIDKANIVIDNLPKSPFWTDPVYASRSKQLYGEAVTLRALSYHYLIALWGDVPFLTHSVQGDDNFYQPKTDRDTIYETCIEDLKNVEDDVPWLSQTLTSERINKAFVKGLRARMCLMYGGWSHRNKTHVTARGRYWEKYYGIARQECLEIMQSGNHTLNPDFENIFKSLCAYKMDLTYGESLFEIAFGKTKSGTLGYLIGMRFSSGDPKYGIGNSQIYAFPQYYYNFDRADKRRDVSTCLYDYTGTGANLSKQKILHPASNSQLTKWRKSWMNPLWGGTNAKASNFGVNLPMMRYSDVILMYAETENELNGPTQSAKDALALVRQRAFPEETWPTTVTHYIDSVGISKADFFNAIVDERYFEFGGEFIRKYDLIRWNLLYTKIAQAKADLLELTSQVYPTVRTVSKYINAPTYIYWKYDSDGETISILNPDYRLPYKAISGYTVAEGWANWTASRQNVYWKNYDRIANGLDPIKNNYLYPLGPNVIASSRGVLSNDQMP